MISNLCSTYIFQLNSFFYSLNKDYVHVYLYNIRIHGCMRFMMGHFTVRFLNTKQIFIFIYLFFVKPPHYGGSEHEHCLGHLSKKCPTCKIYPLTEKKMGVRLVWFVSTQCTVQTFKY